MFLECGDVFGGFWECVFGFGEYVVRHWECVFVYWEWIFGLGDCAFDIGKEFLNICNMFWVVLGTCVLGIGY